MKKETQVLKFLIDLHTNLRSMQKKMDKIITEYDRVESILLTMYEKLRKLNNSK